MVHDIMMEYLQQTGDINENANDGYSICGLKSYTVGKCLEEQALQQAVASEEHRQGWLHIHDLQGSLYSAYCCGHDLRELLWQGLGSRLGTQSAPPKHFVSACDIMMNFLQILSNEWEGAQAFSDVDVLLAPYIYEDLCEGYIVSQKDVEQAIQSLIFGLNYESRQGMQTPFTNFTMRIFVPDEMKDEPVLCQGELRDYTYRDMQPYMDMFNEALFDVLISGDDNGKPFTFPIPTITVDTDDMFQTGSDVPVLDKLWKLAEKFGCPYFANYIGAGGDPEDAKSMCPLSPDTEVIVKSDGNGVRKERIGDIVNNITQKGTVYKVWTDEGWRTANPVKLQKSNMYRVTLSNGDSVKMDARHLQPTMDCVKRADELDIGDWLPYNKSPIDKFPHNGYSMGYAIGAYIGDGSKSSTNSITYSINKNKSELHDNIIHFWCGLMEYDVTITSNENVEFIRVNGNSYDIVKRFVDGNNALEKSMTKQVFNASHDFREGLLDGLKDTDGRGNKRKSIYTSSPQIRDDLCTMLSLMGRKHMCNYTDNREGRYGDNTNYRVDFPERSNYGGSYREDDEYIYHKIVNIEEIDINSDYVYCFEVDSRDHLFMLANGMMTHNCRLNLDVDKVRRATGIWDKGVKTGSLGVCTLNLNRVGIVSRSMEEYLNHLEQLFNVATQQLLQRKDYVRAAFYDYGLMPYSYKYVGTLESFFLTVGVVGAWEGYHNLLRNNDYPYNSGCPETSQISYTQFCETVLNRLLELLERNETETDWKLWNLEQTPAEGSSNRMANLDHHYYPDAFVSGDESGYFLTNSTHPAVYYDGWDVVDTLMFHDSTDKLYTGGTLKNIFIDNINSVDGIMKFIQNVIDNTEIPYVAYTPIYGVCSKHGVCKQRTEECPECGERMPVFTRVVGYFRPMDKFNPGQHNQACLRRYDANNEDVEKVYAGDGVLGR